MAGTGLLLSAVIPNPVGRLLSLALAQMGIMAMLSPFWALPTAFLVGTAAAGGIAFINSVGNLGGFVGPYMMGALKDKTGTFTIPLMALSTALFIGSVLTFTLSKHRAKPS